MNQKQPLILSGKGSPSPPGGGPGRGPVGNQGKPGKGPLIEKYNKAFIEIFYVTEPELSKLAYQSVALWDSVGHMSLIAELEEAFNIMIETDDIIDFNSYLKGFEILKKYGIGL